MKPFDVGKFLDGLPAVTKQLIKVEKFHVFEKYDKYYMIAILLENGEYYFVDATGKFINSYGHENVNYNLFMKDNFDETV